MQNETHFNDETRFNGNVLMEGRGRPAMRESASDDADNADNEDRSGDGCTGAGTRQEGGEVLGEGGQVASRDRDAAEGNSTEHREEVEEEDGDEQEDEDGDDKGAGQQRQRQRQQSREKPKEETKPKPKKTEATRRWPMSVRAGPNRPESGSWQRGPPSRIPKR